MLDQYGRSINYMRISLTDRCNLHCSYCRPLVGEQLFHADILRYEEILRVVRAVLDLGISRFKVTGGEPFVRRGAVDFLEELRALPGVEQVTLTTNGTLAEEHISRLVKMGIDGINFSLDTLDPVAYKELTGGSLAPVLASIAAAVGAGLRCKLNCVPLAHVLRTDADVLALVRYARSLHLSLRFIELMPLACNGALVSRNGSELRELFRRAGLMLTLESASLGNGPATYYRTSAGDCLGFIEPVYHKFCASCNRVRLTSTGALKTCLYSAPVCDLRELLRGGASEEKLREALRSAILTKPLGHAFAEAPADFAMSDIGG